jgi:hypothetical protein
MTKGFLRCFFKITFLDVNTILFCKGDKYFIIKHHLDLDQWFYVYKKDGGIYWDSAEEALGDWKWGRVEW